MRATVRDAMSTDVATVPRHASVDDAERLLLQSGLDELFVTDEQGLLVGILPDYALLKRRMVAGCQTHQTVDSLMSRRFLVIGADSPLTVAGRYLREHVHRRLAVVDGMRLMGQVTRRSVLRLLATQELETQGPCESGQGEPTQPVETDARTQHRQDGHHLQRSRTASASRSSGNQPVLEHRLT